MWDSFLCNLLILPISHNPEEQLKQLLLFFLQWLRDLGRFSDYPVYCSLISRRFTIWGLWALVPYLFDYFGSYRLSIEVWLFFFFFCSVVLFGLFFCVVHKRPASTMNTATHQPAYLWLRSIKSSKIISEVSKWYENF